MMKLQNGWSALLVLATFVGLGACGGGGGGGGTSLEDQQASWSLTNSSTTSLLGWDDDFSTLSGAYAEAANKYPGNKVAPMMKSLVDFLAWTKDSLNDPTDSSESLRSMLARAGIMVETANLSFWDYEFLDTTNGGTNLPANFIKTDEILELLHERIRPQIETIISKLDDVPADLSYLLKPNTSDPLEYEMDIGDVALARSSLRFALAGLAIINGYDLANYDLKELQLPDPFANWDTLYSSLGKVASVAEQRRARNLIRDAFRDYGVAAARIRGETTSQADRGLVTLGANTFSSTAERNLFMSRESRFRTTGQEAVNAMYRDSAYSITRDLDGMAIPAASVVSVNLFKLTEGLNLREVFLNVIPDYISGGHTFGVRGVGGITPAMYTLGGAFVSLGGNAPGPGDRQERGSVGVLVENVPIHTKVLDGSFGDWSSTNSVLVAAEPQAVSAGVGNVWASRDGNYLYLRVDKNLAGLLSSSSWGEFYEIMVASSEPWKVARITQYSTGSLQVNNAEMQVSASGHEIRIPLSTFAPHKYVSLAISVEAGSAGIHSSRQRVYIEIRK